MKIKKLNIIKNLVTAIAVTLFFACENNYNDVQNVGVLQNQPIGEATNINLKYTEYNDSVVDLLANLISPKMLDYSNRSFSFSEFPKGIELKVYDDEQQETTILANYAIYYTDKDIIDLQGNVRVATPEKDTLFTAQLYYNEKSEWVFTNEPFIFKRTTGITHGIGFDSDKTFKKFQMLEMGGDIEIDN
ncbi:LPS export ABC transporter periplasmic protein LptC [Winogradskyella sp.]|uniref:LPS export ABC transporter periplasmic protein LptC n=1 Tax=uncultured Winogradskyella sp. TaxID=395353 RepID=UPI0023359278|nr:LPS export ABC transporter periplasmic protein LptC [Winogradskyella sp.]MDC0008961.1 LPS export ABC transporter periplasmic protein LptC [Winogradskyella sp.]MDC1504406.1 LPS export ABC transporter periplasmic protein LptC [Winogradskyella sp.]|tara:strand:- start:40973 stop:41539 length:567 start_codon:yes stop_codon:yes gene_type:complete